MLSDYGKSHTESGRSILQYNAVIANWLLGEKITKWDIVSHPPVVSLHLCSSHRSRRLSQGGWSFIGVGIGLCAYYMPKKNHDVSADELLTLASQPSAVMYQLVVFGLIIGLTIAVGFYERAYPIGATDEPAFIKLCATLAYPTVLALYESLIQLCLKGVSNMLTETLFSADNQLTNWKFWLVFVLMGVFVIGVMFWMRKVTTATHTTVAQHSIDAPSLSTGLRSVRGGGDAPNPGVCVCCDLRLRIMSVCSACERMCMHVDVECLLCVCPDGCPDHRHGGWRTDVLQGIRGVGARSDGLSDSDSRGGEGGEGGRRWGGGGGIFFSSETPRMGEAAVLSDSPDPVSAC